MLAIQKKLSNSFYALLSLPSTAMGFALSVQISALSWILSTKYNLEIHEIGLVWAAGPIAGIFGQIIFGIISDNVWFWNGRRRPFILIGGFIAALMLLALPNIGIISSSLDQRVLAVAIAVALSLDLAINVSFNPTRSIIADVTPEGEQRTKGYTWMQTISGTFGVLAYVIAAVMGNIALIYIGAALVFVLSILPTFFIEEPRTLINDENAQKAAETTSVSFLEMLQTIQPLWGFFIYGLYAMTLKLAGIEKSHYYVEIFCFVLTIILLIKAIATSEKGKNPSEAGLIGFQKVLAAHSFTWVGVQTMFVYMFTYVQSTMPELSADQMGQVVSIAFLIFNAVAAILPAFVLEPITRNIGRVRTHAICITIMAIGYAGVYLFGNSSAMIYGLMLVLGVGWAATVSLPFAIMSQKVEQSKMGLYMGLFNLSVVLPQLVASLGIGEAVSAAPNKNLIFLICTGTLGLSAVLWYFIKENETSEDVEISTPTGH
ncbi:MAG: MFS transporter [Bacteroidota bacterium]